MSAPGARSSERLIPRALPAVRVIGIGETLRGDDGAGPRVTRALAGAGLEGVWVTECAGGLGALLDLWEGAEAVVVVDALRSGAAPGTLLRLDARAGSVPAAGGVSSHGLGLAEAIELGRTLGRLPPVLVVHGIEGADFAPGAGLSPAVAAALPALAGAVRAEALRLAAAHARRQRPPNPDNLPPANRI